MASLLGQFITGTPFPAADMHLPEIQKTWGWVARRGKTKALTVEVTLEGVVGDELVDEQALG